MPSLAPSLVHRFRNTLRLAAVACTGSVMFGLAAPPSRRAYLVWLGFAPLWWVHRRLRACEQSRPTSRAALLRRFMLGWMGGLGTGLVGFPWIALTLTRFADFPWWLAGVGLFAFAAWTALPYGLWLAGCGLMPLRGWQRFAVPMALWLALSSFWPALFPYTPVLGLVQTPAWIQGAELGGVALCEAQVLACGMLLGEAACQRAPRPMLTRVALALALVATSFGLGHLRMQSIAAQDANGPHVRIAAIQPNVPIFFDARQERIDRMRKTSARAQEAGAEVIVWPEAGPFPFSAPHGFTGDSPNPEHAILGEHSLPTMLGIATYDDEGGDFNSFVLLDVNGRVSGWYDKVNLVPFGEHIPVVDPQWARRLIPAMSHLTPGAGPGRIRVQAGPPDQPGPTFNVGPLICYEDILPRFARQTAAQPGGIELFVNATIDTWFGNTAEPWEHLALAQFRSVEHRIAMVRSVVAGPSSIVAPTGELAHALEVQDPTPQALPPAQYLLAEVPIGRNTERNPTVFARFGWLLPWIGAAASIAFVLAAWRRSRQPSQHHAS